MFIFSGSKRHLMSNMFNSSSKPFYQSAISIGLKPIPIHIYVEFANRLFEQRGKLIDKSVIEEVYRMFDGYTWFVQMIMNELFALTEEGERCSMDKIEIARKNVILTQESSYKDLLANLAPKQKLVLQRGQSRRSHVISIYQKIQATLSQFCTICGQTSVEK